MDLSNVHARSMAIDWINNAMPLGTAQWVCPVMVVVIIIYREKMQPVRRTHKLPGFSSTLQIKSAAG
jgi:hypothetical protein